MPSFTKISLIIIHRKICSNLPGASELKLPCGIVELGYDGFKSLQWYHNERNGVSNHQPYDCLLDHLFRRKSKKTPKLRFTGLCEGNSPVTGEFAAQRASKAENVSIWWCHHVAVCCIINTKPLPLLMVAYSVSAVLRNTFSTLVIKEYWKFVGLKCQSFYLPSTPQWVTVLTNCSLRTPCDIVKLGHHGFR